MPTARADLDDGFESRLLTLDQIRNGIPVFERFYREVESIYPDVIDKLKFNEALKRMLNRWVGDLIDNTKEQMRHARISNLEAVRSCPHRLVTLSPPVEQERRQVPRNFSTRISISAQRSTRRKTMPSE